MKRINLLYQTDDNFAFLAGVSITSLVTNSSKNVDYHIYYLDGGLSEENKNKLQEIIEPEKMHFSLTFLDSSYCAKTVKEWNVPDHRGSYVTYYKLLLNHYFEGADVEQILHIGADTIVTGSLEELATFDFEGKPFAMNPYGYNFFERYIPKDCNYCIAEMVYFNLPVWREMRCEERLKAHIAQIGEIYGGKDQGLLNVEFKNEFALLPLKYNIYGITVDFSKKNQRRFISKRSATDIEVIEAYSKPEIIHIARTFLFRPHEIDSIDPNYDLWWKYCRISPWKDIVPFPQPEVIGGMEKIMRNIWISTPKEFHDRLYIFLRKLNGKINEIKYPARNEKNQKAEMKVWDL